MTEYLDQQIQKAQTKVDQIQEQIHILEVEQRKHLDNITYLNRIREES